MEKYKKVHIGFVLLQLFLTAGALSLMHGKVEFWRETAIYQTGRATYWREEYFSMSQTYLRALTNWNQTMEIMLAQEARQQ